MGAYFLGERRKGREERERPTYKGEGREGKVKVSRPIE